jgi:hypothetical protein
MRIHSIESECLQFSYNLPHHKPTGPLDGTIDDLGYRTQRGIRPLAGLAFAGHRVAEPVN